MNNLGFYKSKKKYETKDLSIMKNDIILNCNIIQNQLKIGGKP